MADGKQKYLAIENRDLDDAAKGHNHRSTGFRPKQLKQGSNTETQRMRSAHIPIVNPVTAGDKSVAQNSCRVYEKGRKNRTRT